jgi:hypothetical protein
MKPILTAAPVLVGFCLAICDATAAEPAARPNVLRAGTNFISTHVYSVEVRAAAFGLAATKSNP